MAEVEYSKAVGPGSADSFDSTNNSQLNFTWKVMLSCNYSAEVSHVVKLWTRLSTLYFFHRRQSRSNGAHWGGWRLKHMRLIWYRRLCRG